MTCKHEFQYYLESNEAGWRCCLCEHKPGEPTGFSPELDRVQLERKVFAVLDGLHNADVIYISNGTGGDMLMADVAERCREVNRYDQYSIALFVLEATAPRHAEYWKQISDAIVAGKDPRDRCHCGKLATVTSFANGNTTRRCSAHAFDDAKERPERSK